MVSNYSTCGEGQVSSLHYRGDVYVYSIYCNSGIVTLVECIYVYIIVILQ